MWSLSGGSLSRGGNALLSQPASRPAAPQMSDAAACGSAATGVQRVFRGYEARKRIKWKAVYLRVRRKLVFRSNAVEAADTRRLQSTIQTLKSLVPHVVYTRVKEGTWRPSDTGQNAFSTRIEASVAFIDISGFVTLTEQMVETQIAKSSGSAKSKSVARGQGAEVMMRVLNAHFSCLIDIVHDHGGDVLKFAGDALQVLFPVLDDELTPQTEGLVRGDPAGGDSARRPSGNELARADCACRAIEASPSGHDTLSHSDSSGERRRVITFHRKLHAPICS